MSLRVVIATDGSEEAVQGAARSLQFIPADAEVRLVTVIAARYDPAADQGGFEGPIMTESEADQDFADSRAAGREAIERTERSLGDRMVEEQILAAADTVVRTLVDYTEREHVDLLIVGASNTGFFERLIYGPTDEQLVRHATCPVLVMNHPRS